MRADTARLGNNPAMAIDRNTICVEVFSSSCCYQGLVVNRGIRLADMLSDPTSDLLEIQDVVVHPHGYPSAGIRCPQVLIKKSEVLAVIPQGNFPPPEWGLPRIARLLAHGSRAVAGAVGPADSLERAIDAAQLRRGRQRDTPYFGPRLRAAES
jgi:hypothetical protein